MFVERNSTDLYGLLPKAVEYLDADFHLPLYHRDLKLRTPLGIYNVSLHSVIEAFEDVLNEFEYLMNLRPFRGGNLQDELTKWSDRNLMSRQRQLLYSLMEHMEDCFNILKCFVPPPSPDPRRRTKKAYCGASTIIERCVNSVESYWTHISDIVNHSKHNQGRICFCIIFDENIMIPGYFVESSEKTLDPANDNVVDWEVLGPSSEIHGKYRKTAFSFARDLRFHFVNVYFVANEISIAVDQLSSGRRDQLNRGTSNDSKIREIATRIENLPLYFFSDEMRMEVPRVSIIEFSDTNFQLRLTYPDVNTILLSPPHGKKMRVWTGYIGDGVSNKLLMPYFSS